MHTNIINDLFFTVNAKLDMTVPGMLDTEMVYTRYKLKGGGTHTHTRISRSLPSTNLTDHKSYGMAGCIAIVNSKPKKP